MKKLFFLSIMLASAAFAQAQIKLGVQAQGIVASQSAKSDGVSITGSDRISWKAGVVADYALSSKLSLTPQLNVVNKGGKYALLGFDFKSSLTYLELPVNLTYHYKGFFVGAGPVISMGLTGTEQYDNEKVDVKFDGKTESDEFSHYKRFEFGANLQAGYQLKNGLFINAGYTLGLSNIAVEDGGSLKNRYFSVGIGYFFKR